jgi:hypothetical protein
MSTLESVTVKLVLLSFFFFPPSKTFERWNGGYIQEGLLMREIEDLPVVSSLSFIHTIGRDKTKDSDRHVSAYPSGPH